MKRLTVAAAAFAAGMLALVAQSHAEREHDTFGATKRAAASTEKTKEKTGEPKDKKEAKSANAVSAKRANSANAASPKRTGMASAGAQRKLAANTAKPKQVSSKAGGHKKGRVKINLDKPVVDAQTTASVARARPALKAVARKAVTGLDAVETNVRAVGSAAFTAIVARYASSNGVPASLAQAVITVESSFVPDKLGRAGEIGLMQIKPATARMMGYSGSASGLYDPETNIKFGMKYLGKAHQLSGGETCGTILRYNAGHGARRMNPISAAYCSKVKALLGG